MRMRLLAAIAVILAPLSTQSQDMSAPNAPIAQIVVLGHGEVKITPDRASIQLSVQTRGATAAIASAENANKQQAVLNALRALGLGNDQLSTVNYNVYPEQRYQEGKDPVIVGYNVTNTILAEVRKPSQVGSVIDAALAHGANTVTSLQFFASNTEAARRTAIAQAIDKARADAEAAARAAHGSLGTLLEINVGAYTPAPPRPLVMFRAAAGAAQAETPINPGEDTVSVDVSTRWRFVPTP
jgi:uncharacterized protein YggE